MHSSILFRASVQRALQINMGILPVFLSSCHFCLCERAYIIVSTMNFTQFFYVAVERTKVPLIGFVLHQYANQIRL